jgi:hypothetical protein
VRIRENLLYWKWKHREEEEAYTSSHLIQTTIGVNKKVTIGLLDWSLVLRTSYTFLIVPNLRLIPNLWDLLETCDKSKISPQEQQFANE